MNANEQGFTLVELISVMVVSSIFAGLIFIFTFNFWQYSYLLQADEETLSNRLSASDFMRESFGTSNGLIIQNSIPDPNAHNPDPLIATDDYWVPIHAIPGNKPVGAFGTTTPLVYYRRHSVDTNNNIIFNGTQPFDDEYVLYMDGTSKRLLLRSLANPSASGNRLKTSCPPAAATPTCPADKIIMEDLASTDMKYFSRSGNLVDYTSIVDPATGAYAGPDFPVVDVIQFTLNISRKPIFQKTNATQSSTIIRVALRNT